MIMQFEGTRFLPYQDVAGIWTVCSGHTGADVIPGRPWSKQQCDEVTRKDLTTAAVGLLSCTIAPLGQHQFEALTSWTYNVGVLRACDSTLVRRLNMGDYQSVTYELMRWVNAGGKRVPGLVNRRYAEAMHFSTPDFSPASIPVAHGFMDAPPSVMFARPGVERSN